SSRCRQARSSYVALTRSTRPKCWRATPKSSGCCARCRATRSPSSFGGCKPRASPRKAFAGKLMQIRPDDLPAHLARALAPIYVVHGDEPLIALEAADAIRSAARAAGCDERDVIVVEPGFKWDAFAAANANLGLFAS